MTRETIEAENILFKLEKKRADDSKNMKVEEEVAEQKKQAEVAEEWVKAIEKWAQKLESEISNAFEERVLVCKFYFTHKCTNLL